MLDINIVHANKAILHNGQQVGVIPHLELGSYTDLSLAQNSDLTKASQKISNEDFFAFEDILNKIGQRLYGEDLLKARETANHLAVIQTISEELRKMFNNSNQSADQLKLERELLQKYVENKFSPEARLSMLVTLKKQQERIEQYRLGAKENNQPFVYGFAKNIQMIRDIKEKKKSGPMKGLSRRPTHRWAKDSGNQI